jgi:Flp pilus assembly protein TadG
MKMKPARVTEARRGVVIPLVALLLIPLLAMMAFSIDIGYGVEVRAELVNAADAAALAGVQQLYAPYKQWVAATGSVKTTILNNAVSNAKATATAVANSNRAGGASVQLVASDVDVGYTDASGAYYSGNQGSIPAGAFPNTVKVTSRRDNTSLPNSNGELPLFFGPVLGKGSIALTASATAVAYEGQITSFKSIPGVNGTLLPVAVDQTQWTDFYQNGASSLYADPNAPSGKAWLQIYPGGTGASMDGLLSLNGSKAAAATYYSGGPPGGGWIQCGPTPSDITGLHSAGDLPLPTGGTGQTWDSGPGMTSSLLRDFQALITTPPTVRLLPLFDPNSAGTTGGGNGTYQITYFVPVYVVYADATGKPNMDIAVVPAAGSPVTDPTAVFGNLSPMGTSTIPAQYIVPVAAKLTQ